MNTKMSLEMLDGKSLSDLPEIFEKIGEVEAQIVARNLERYAIWLIRAARYLEARSYDMQDHMHAVKEQNKIIAKVRRALGHSYPKQNITW